MITFTIDNETWCVVKAFAVKQRVGRPRRRMAKYELQVKRLRGNRPYKSYLYHDGTFCKPF